MMMSSDRSDEVDRTGVCLFVYCVYYGTVQSAVKNGGIHGESNSLNWFKIALL